jgi:transposase
MSTIIGVDVSKDSFDTAFEKDIKKFVQGKFDNCSEGFCLFYDSLPQGERIIVMEATGPYYLKLAYFLHEKGEKVSVVNPLKIRRFAQMRFERVKTDKADARIIASYGKSEEIKLWEPMEEHIVDIRQICSVMERMVKDRTAWMNKQEALNNDPKHSLIAMREVEEMIAYITKKLEDMENKLDEIVKDHFDDQNKIIRSIPGIGPKTAIILLALTNGFTRFDTYKEFISYVGLSPRIYDSGTIKSKAHICKLGMSRARQLLYMAARAASKYNTACKLLYDRLLEKGKAKKLALIAVANKLVKQAFALISKSELYAKDFAL